MFSEIYIIDSKILIIVPKIFNIASKTPRYQHIKNPPSIPTYDLQGLISSQVVVWDFFHQEYLHTFLVKFHRVLTNRPGPPISIADVSGNGTPKFQGNLIPFGQKPCLSIYLLYWELYSPILWGFILSQL